MKTFSLVTMALLATGAVAQGIPSSLPRLFDAGDNPSPTAIIGWYWYKVSSPAERLPAKGNLPATANLVHLTYADTDNFVPQIEYRCSTDGGLSFGAPVALHKLSQGEVLVNDTPQLVCEGHNVFFVFRSNLFDTTGTSVAVYAYGSDDAGQTWQGPLLLTPAYTGTTPTLKHVNSSPSSPEVDAAAAGGRLHVVSEAVQTATGAPNLEEAYYSSAEFDASGKFVARKTDVRISEFGKPNEFDVDFIHIDASGRNVGIVWYDDRLGLGNTANWTFARISNDGGDTWGAEVDVNQATLDASNQPTVPSVDEPDIAIAGDNVYICYEDMRNNKSQDNLFLMFSNDAGKTWTRVDKNNNRIMLNVQVASDVDEFDIDAHGDTLFVTWMEDLGKGNSANLAYAWVDTKKGADTVAGSVTAVDLSALSNHAGDINIVEQCDVKGRFLSAAYEGATGESAVMAWSCDSGATWRIQQVSDGKRDVDEPYCESTLNGDHNIVYIEDFGTGNNGNKTVVTGIKTPTLENDAAATSGVAVSCAMGSVGAIAVTVFSDKLATKNSPGVQLPGIDGRLGIQGGLVFSVGLDVVASNPTPYVGVIDSKGELALPNVPNFTSLIGVPIYCVVVTAKSEKQAFEFTDPVALR